MHEILLPNYLDSKPPCSNIYLTYMKQITIKLFQKIQNVGNSGFNCKHKLWMEHSKFTWIFGISHSFSKRIEPLQYKHTFADSGYKWNSIILITENCSNNLQCLISFSLVETLTWGKDTQINITNISAEKPKKMTFLK